MSEDDHVNNNNGDKDDNQHDQVKSQTDLLLQSPTALEVLGRGLLLTLSPLMSQQGQASTALHR